MEKRFWLRLSPFLTSLKKMKRFASHLWVYFLADRVMPERYLGQLVSACLATVNRLSRNVPQLEYLPYLRPFPSCLVVGPAQTSPSPGSLSPMDFSWDCPFLPNRPGCPGGQIPSLNDVFVTHMSSALPWGVSGFPGGRKGSIRRSIGLMLWLSCGLLRGLLPPGLHCRDG